MISQSTKPRPQLSPRQLAKARSRRARLTRGFTLTELMVSITGGLFISLTVFTLARQSSRFYQREGRVATATLGSIVGFERLRADIARAGFLSSPNILNDNNHVCGSPLTENWPVHLGSLQSVLIEDAVLPTEVEDFFANNSIVPQQITISGSLSSPDQFEVRSVAPGSDNVIVYLNPNSGAMQRLLRNNGGGAEVTEEQLEQVFGDDRAVRIVDLAGRHHYGTIEGRVGGASPQIILSADTPPIHLPGAAVSSADCVLQGNEPGLMINVVNIVRYELRWLKEHAAYSVLYPTVGGPGALEYDDVRVDLVRVELDVDGNTIESTLELIAEYVVDLHFAATVLDQSVGQLQTYSEADMDPWTGLIESGDTDGPQQIRTLWASLSVRSREADRTVPLNAAADTPFRVALSTVGGNVYARVRSVQARVALNNNHIGVSE